MTISAKKQTRQQKLIWVMATLIGTIIAVCLILYAIREQTDLYYDPISISTGKAPENKRIRVGGVVVAGSLQRDPKQQNNPLDIQFMITDCQASIKVNYQGILPDLFKENSGVVATGKLQGKEFFASEILAKHDENYMPPEVAKSMPTGTETVCIK